MAIARQNKTDTIKPVTFLWLNGTRDPKRDISAFGNPTPFREKIAKWEPNDLRRKK
jgi:hypothetical protein